MSVAAASEREITRRVRRSPGAPSEGGEREIMSRPRLGVLVGSISLALVAWVFAMGAWASPAAAGGEDRGAFHQQGPATVGVAQGAAWLVGPGPAALFVLGGAVSIWPVRRRAAGDASGGAAGSGRSGAAPASEPDRPGTMAA